MVPTSSELHKSSSCVFCFCIHLCDPDTSVKDKNMQDERELHCLSGPGCCPASAPPAGQPWPGSSAPSGSGSLARSGLSSRSVPPGFLCIVHKPNVSPTDQSMADTFNLNLGESLDSIC